MPPPPIMCRGVFGPYRKSSDPWQRDNVRDFMRSFWRTTMDWLRQVRGRERGCVSSALSLPGITR